jgi:predicted enzyme related to lactoylglutathione lyase
MSWWPDVTAVARFLFITIDAQDARRIAEFWGAMFDSPIDEELDDGRYLVLKDRDDLPAIAIQRVPEPKHGKVRIHLDLGPKDLEEATERIVALGGSWDGEDRTLDDFVWRTFADPEGHEFDVIKTRT